MSRQSFLRKLSSWLAVATAAMVVLCPKAAFAGASMESYISEVDGSSQPFGLYLPEPFDPDVPHPVVFHLHGGGGRADTNFPNTAFANARGWIMVKPDARGPHPLYVGLPENDVFRVLEEVRARFKVDENRIYTMGCSSGGFGSLRFAFTYPDVFAAAGVVDGPCGYFELHASYFSPVGASSEVHPARVPLLEGLSADYFAENGKHVNLYLGVDTNDSVAPTQWSYDFHDQLTQLGYEHSYHLFPGGHCSGYNSSEICQFISEHVRDPNPQHVIHRANQLKYGSAYWVRMDRLEKKLDAGRFATVVAKVTGKQKDIVEVTANGLVQFTLFLTPELVEVAEVTVVVNGESVYTGAPQKITVSSSLDESGNITGWSIDDILPRGLRKTARIEGPIDDAYMSKFLAVFGTTSKPDTSRNYAQAQGFRTEWNTVWNASISPVEDTSITAHDIATSNLILFGTADSNSIIEAINDLLPVRIWNNRIVAGATEYVGENYGVYMIFPNPLNPERYLLISHGAVEGLSLAADWLGIAFTGPDYSVFDKNIVPRRRPSDPYHTNPPYVPDTWVEGGYFDQYWRLDNDEDGMDDIFEKQIIDADPDDAVATIEDVNADHDFDGDGQDNRTEYNAGTDATDADSHFSVVSVAPDPADGANFQVSWKLAPGRSYYILWSDSMEGAWHEIAQLDPADVSDKGDVRTWTDRGTHSAMEWKKPGDCSARLYKVAAYR